MHRLILRQVASFFLFLSLVGRVQAQTFTVDSGVTLNSGPLSQGCSWVDLNGDSLLDLCVTTAVFSPAAVNLVFLNQGAGAWLQSFAAPLATDLTSTAAQTWGDYDNDGRIDAFLCNPGSTNILYRNLGGGSFSKPSVPMTQTSGQDYAAVWGDYDNDGNLDLISGTRDVVGSPSGTLLELYHNDGAGSFNQILAGDPVATPHNYAYPSWIDYDYDGDLDLFVSTGAPVATENDVLFRNQLVETATADFEPDTSSGITQDSADGLFPAWGDYDNDGLLDLYLTTWGGLTTAKPNILYHATAPGTFAKVTNPATGTLITASNVSTGATWGDYDNDGDLDLFTTEQTSTDNKLHSNNGNGTFADVTVAAQVTPVGGYASHGAAWCDFDKDGDLDLFVTFGYFSPGSRNRIYKNGGNSNHWLSITCAGYNGNNRSAIGARVGVLATIGGNPVWQTRVVTSSSGFFSTVLDQHFGLGDATVVDSIEVIWPNGTITGRSNVGADQFLSIDDCADPDGDNFYCLDNCPDTANPGQEDADGDHWGDACDNCLKVGNPSQSALGMVGDVNASTTITSADIIHMVNHVFKSGPPPVPCAAYGDVNCSGNLSSADIISLVNYVFKGGAPPCDVCTLSPGNWDCP